MTINMNEIDNKGLLHSFNPYWSRPEYFFDFIKKYGKTTYRSTLWINFDNFRPFFVVFFVEKGTNGKIPAWGLCDRDASKEQSKDVKKKNDEGSPFMKALYGFPGEKSSKFKRVFYYKKMGLFKKPHNCSEFVLIKNQQPISNLRILRSALYVGIPPEIFDEIKEDLKE